MLRKALIATSLLFVSGSALAIDEYISRPRVSITFGGGHHDYGHRDIHYQEVYVPRPVHVQPVYYNNYYQGGGRRHHGWQQRDAHHDEWRNDRHQRRHHRGHHDDD